jgi:micrococcal nuclease
MKSFALVPVLILLLSVSCMAQKKIAAKDAVNHKGETLMICDKVFNTEVSKTENTTLLYVGSEDGRYLTILVKGPEHPKFNWHPERDFKGRAICVTGKIVDYNGKPAIYVTEASQLKPDMVDSPIKRKF